MNPSFSTWPHSPVMPPSNPTDITDKQKKARHRHSPTQLAALNDLFDKTEHPSLEQRSALGTRLGMETKTVNAWFQNKRASSKKRSRGGTQFNPPSVNSLVDSASSSVINTPRQHEFDDFLDEDFHPSPPSLEQSHQHVAFYTGNPVEHNLYPDFESNPRRLRMRPSTEQTKELKRLYNDNPHPTKEEREDLGERIGMRYQSITNWFQNQRSLAKKRKEDEAEGLFTTSTQKSMASDIQHESRTFSAFPPPSSHPSLPHSLSQQRNHPSPVFPHRRSPSVSRHQPTALEDDSHLVRRSSPRRSSTPYRNSGTALSRPRRSRPEPYQLEALKELFTRTSIPSIEERSALAFEIGMDVGKVTNWFRNLRQTARKRAKKFGPDYDGDEDSINGHSRSVSRSVSPSFFSSSNGDSMELDGEGQDCCVPYETISDDDFPEAVTPSPEPTPSPTSPMCNSEINLPVHISSGRPIDAAAYAELERFTAQRFSGVKLEDALLLLSFHQNVVQ